MQEYQGNQLQQQMAQMQIEQEKKKLNAPPFQPANIPGYLYGPTPAGGGYLKLESDKPESFKNDPAKLLEFETNRLRARYGVEKEFGVGAFKPEKAKDEKSTAEDKRLSTFYKNIGTTPESWAKIPNPKWWIERNFPGMTLTYNDYGNPEMKEIRPQGEQKVSLSTLGGSLNDPVDVIMTTFGMNDKDIPAEDKLIFTQRMATGKLKDVKAVQGELAGIAAVSGTNAQYFADKNTKEDKKYFSKEDIGQISEFSQKFGAEPWLAVKFNREGWFFLPPSEIGLTKGGFVFSLESAKTKGLSFTELLNRF